MLGAGLEGIPYETHGAGYVSLQGCKFGIFGICLRLLRTERQYFKPSRSRSGLHVRKWRDQIIFLNFLLCFSCNEGILVCFVNVRTKKFNVVGISTFFHRQN